MNINFDEFKNKITSGKWEKIGSKFNNPVLSIFPLEVKKHLLNIEYEPNKLYYFDDDTHDFKIQSLIDDGKPFFVIFAKDKNPIIIEQKESPKKGKYKYTTKFDTAQIAIIVSVAVVLIAAVLLSGPILHVFGV